MAANVFPVVAVALILGTLGGLLGLELDYLDMDCNFPERCDPLDRDEYCLLSGDFVTGHCRAKQVWCKYGMAIDPQGRCICRYFPDMPICNDRSGSPDIPSPPGQ